MNNLIDSLFKKKLEAHSIDPGSNSWSRVASNLPKKNKSIIWFRAAAVLLLAGIASVIWFYSNNQTPTSDSIAQTEKIDPAKKEASPIQKSEPQQFITSNPPLNKKQRDEPIIIKKVKPTVDDPSIPIDIQNESMTEVTLTETPEELQPEEFVAAVTKPIVIVYELKNINKKTPAQFEEDAIPEKKNGLRKVLDVANDMRTSENPFSELRQAKEEIFAFNFKKETKNNK